jgi:hypothetical protein
MDWTKQNEEMFNTWKQAQTKMWEAYTESVSNFGKSPSEKAWDQAIAAGNELIKNSLTSQADWLKAWVDNIKKLDRLPDQATVALDQFQEMNASWVATQEKLWGAWFEMLKKSIQVSSRGLGVICPKIHSKAGRRAQKWLWILKWSGCNLG